MSTNSYYASLQNNMYLMIPHLYTRVLFILGAHTCLFAAYLGLFVLLFSLFITVWFVVSVVSFFRLRVVGFFFTLSSHFVSLHAFSHDLYTIPPLFVKVRYRETVKRDSIRGPRVRSC